MPAAEQRRRARPSPRPRRAFTSTSWSRDRELRAKVLRDIADAIRWRRVELIDLLCRENGKTRQQAAFEIDGAPPKLRYYAALALTDTGSAAELRPGLYAMTLREPAGVAASTG